MEIDLDTAIFALSILSDQRRVEQNFGNAGAINNLLSSAKTRMMCRG